MMDRKIITQEKIMYNQIERGTKCSFIFLIITVVCSICFSVDQESDNVHKNLAVGNDSSVLQMNTKQDSIDAGRHIVMKSIDFLGGKDILSEINDMRIEAVMNITTPRGEVSMLNNNELLFNNKVYLKSEITTPEGVILSVFDGENAAMKTPEGMRILKGEQLEEMMQSIFCNSINLLKGVIENRFQARFIDMQSLREQDIFLIEINDQHGRSAQLLIDVSDYRLIGKSYETISYSGTVLYDEWYEQFRVVNGFKFPYDIRIDLNKNDYGRTRVEEIKVNNGIVKESFYLAE